MDGIPASKKKWELTAEAFNKLLASLDADPDQAAARYEIIREKLTTFFENRGCLIAAELTDESIDRVARKLDEGSTIYASNPDSYFYAVARNVLREYWDRPKNEELPEEDLPADAESDSEQIEDDKKKELLFDCQKNCVDGLSADARRLVIDYYQEDAGTKMKQKREKLAAQMDMTANALRIKACRIRDKLDNCVLRCVEGSQH